MSCRCKRCSSGYFASAAGPFSATTGIFIAENLCNRKKLKGAGADVESWLWLHARLCQGWQIEQQEG